ncbi:MAG: hypothetical protein U0K35_05655, partial [Prevotella sp.]|nr:hypothetical protein [Prevotella sp.]
MKKIATIMPHFLRSLFTLSFPASPFHLFLFTLALCSLLFALSSCKKKSSEPEYTPWGTPLEHPSGETTPPADSTISLS